MAQRNWFNRKPSRIIRFRKWQWKIEPQRVSLTEAPRASENMWLLCGPWLESPEGGRSEWKGGGRMEALEELLRQHVDVFDIALHHPKRDLGRVEEHWKTIVRLLGRRLREAKGDDQINLEILEMLAEGATEGHEAKFFAAINEMERGWISRWTEDNWTDRTSDEFGPRALNALRTISRAGYQMEPETVARLL